MKMLNTQIVIVCFVVCGVLMENINGFIPASTPRTTQTSSCTSIIAFANVNHRKSDTALKVSPEFKQRPGENDMAYIKRITSLSIDAATFEKGSQASSKHSTNVSRNNGKDDGSGDSQQQPPKKNGYKPIEQWEADRNIKGELSWEEKVRFDGQRFGNQVRQDTILRQNLKAF